MKLPKMQGQNERMGKQLPETKQNLTKNCFENDERLELRVERLRFHRVCIAEHKPKQNKNKSSDKQTKTRSPTHTNNKHEQQPTAETQKQEHK